jgi:hypothetical protein
MKDDIVPWLDENVGWDGEWELVFDEGSQSVARRYMLFVFRVATLEDAVLIRLKFT